MNRILKALSNSSQAVIRATGEAAYLNEVCRIVQRDCGYTMVWIGYARDDAAKSIEPMAQAGFEEGYLQTLQLTWGDGERGRGPTGKAIRTGLPAGCQNMLTDPSFAPWRNEALRRGYASSLAIPLLADGKAIGAVTIYARESGAFTAEETALLSELADDVSGGITSLRLRATNAAVEAALRSERDAARDRERELSAIYDNAPLIMLLVDGNQRIQKANRLAGLSVGAESDALLGHRAGEALRCVHIRDDARGCGFGSSCQHCTLRQAIAGTISTGQGHDQVEVGLAGSTAEGSRISTYLLSTMRVAVRGAPMALVTMQDITARKQAEEALQRARAELELRVADRTARLRALAAELTQSEERERRRIAQVLHDDLQQLLVGARLRLEAVRGRSDARPMAADLQRIEQLLNESGEVARDLSHELSPTVLHEHGLVRGLQWLSQWMRDKHGLSVAVAPEPAAEALEDDVKVMLYQSARELLFNVVKHSGVKQAELQMGVAAPGWIEIVVSDEGRGFVVAKAGTEPSPGGGFGLFAIRERLALIGGHMEVGNGPAGGCRCRLIAPLPGRRAGRLLPDEAPRAPAGDPPGTRREIGEPAARTRGARPDPGASGR